MKKRQKNRTVAHSTMLTMILVSILTTKDNKSPIIAKTQRIISSTTMTSFQIIDISVITRNYVYITYALIKLTFGIKLSYSGKHICGIKNIKKIKNKK